MDFGLQLLAVVTLERRSVNPFSLRPAGPPTARRGGGPERVPVERLGEAPVSLSKGSAATGGDQRSNRKVTVLFSGSSPIQTGCPRVKP